MMFLNGMVWANKNYKYHFKSINSCNGIDFDNVRINNYIIPRATMFISSNDSKFNKYNIYGIELNDRQYMLPDDCANQCHYCEYSENCNGQFCFFSEL